MIDLVRISLSRCKESQTERAWRRLLTAAPTDVEALFKPLQDGERFTLAVAAGILRPDIHNIAARAFLALRDASTRCNTRVYPETARLWIDVGGDTLSVDELIGFFKENSSYLAYAVDRRLERGCVDEALALRAAINNLPPLSRAKVGAKIARFLANSGQDPLPVLQTACDEATSLFLEQIGNGTFYTDPLLNLPEEAWALTVIMAIAAEFLPPSHPQVVSMIERLGQLSDAYRVKGMHWALSHATIVCANAAVEFSAGWIEHAGGIAPWIANAPEASACLDEAKNWLTQNDGVSPRKRLGAIDNTFAELGLAPRKSTKEKQYEIKSVIERVSAITDFSCRVGEALALGSKSFTSGNRADAETWFSIAFATPPSELSRKELDLWTEALAAADPSAHQSPVHGEVKTPQEYAFWTEIAQALVEGRSDEAMALAEKLPEEELAMLQWAVTHSYGTANADAVSRIKAISSHAQDDDFFGQEEVWRYIIARAHLETGNIGCAIALCRAMGDCRYWGYGPADLVAQIAERLEQTNEWNEPRAYSLLRTLLGDSVLRQVFPQALLEVLPYAYPYVSENFDDRPFRTKLHGLDYMSVDLALARTHARLGDLETTGKFFAAALDGAKHRDNYEIHPQNFLRTLRMAPALPNWAELWRQSFALYRLPRARGVYEHFQQHAAGLTQPEYNLFALAAREPWPEQTGAAIRQSTCALAARGLLDDSALIWLLESATAFADARCAAVAAACVALRRNAPGASEIAALAGLPTDMNGTTAAMASA